MGTPSQNSIQISAYGPSFFQMSASFRFILPKPPMSAASTDTGDDHPNYMHSSVKNLEPCANCSSAQQACIIHPPYSRSLCKKCTLERRNECPQHMPRIDAMLWKQLDRASKLNGATNIQDAIINAPTPVSVDESSSVEETVTHLPPTAPSEFTVQQDQGAEIHTKYADASQMSAFVDISEFQPSASTFRAHNIMTHNFWSYRAGDFILGQIPPSLHTGNEHPLDVHAMSEIFSYQPIPDGNLILGQAQEIVWPITDEINQRSTQDATFTIDNDFARGMFEPQTIDQCLNTGSDVSLDDFELTFIKE